MKALGVCTVVLLTTVLRTAGLAQSRDGQAATTQQDETSASSAPSNSFEALPRILKAGQEVKVTDEMGETTRGQIVSVSHSQLVVARSRLFRPRVDQAFAKDAVRRIDIVDTGANGAAIGGAVAVGFAAALAAGCSHSDSCKNGNFGVPGVFMVSSALFVPLGLGAGYAVDAARDETIYQRPSQAPRVTVAPLVGRHAAGLFAHVHF